RRPGPLAADAGIPCAILTAATLPRRFAAGQRGHIAPHLRPSEVTQFNVKNALCIAAQLLHTAWVYVLRILLSKKIARRMRWFPHLSRAVIRARRLSIWLCCGRKLLRRLCARRCTAGASAAWGGASSES